MAAIHHLGQIEKEEICPQIESEMPRHVSVSMTTDGVALENRIVKDQADLVASGLAT